MKYIFYIFLFIFIFAFVFNLFTRKYVNSYTFSIIFGRKGSGKSTTIQKLAYKYNRKGWHIACNIGDCNYPYAQQVDVSKLWTYFPPYNGKEIPDIPENTVLFIDEINLLWDNRDFKTFPKQLLEFFRLQRHKKIKIIAFSQTFDCDKKLRDLADTLYIIKRKFRLWAYCRCYYKQVVIVRPKDSHQCATMTDDYVPAFRMPLFGSGIITYIPKWVKTFNSFK